ncbi:Trypanosoma vivax [Trypanosoma grayi]|uniref:Trypanosoma vivax n=1 Tax=Trypanosoma grayi TaxID=71804 RepID=UPI0004F41BBC|nr:Trypanosoma vivax [Trypanosoma grayi]KEG12317.1 Trypanosoma vivax [Trypanosoma grayi]
MDVRGGDKSFLGHPGFHMREPDICAVYPTCALICWDPPRTTNELTDTDRRIQWSYVVEWGTDHSLNRTSGSVTTSACHFIMEVHYPNEIINVRIIARGSVLSDIVAFSSAVCKIDASVTIPMPWLHSTSMRCRCIFDGLLFSANGAQCVEAIPPGRGIIKAEVSHARMLESSFACIVVEVVYDAPPPPIPSSIVLYFVICSKALVKQRERLRHYSIQEFLEEKEACAVFCGIGEMGSSAALAAHLLISSVSETSRSLRRRIFCLAYGSPRRMFLEDSLMLVSSSAFSGNFLYYTSLLLTADPFCGYSNALFPTQDAKEVVNSDAADLRFNMPLGVRCGPILDLNEGCHYLQSQCSRLERLSEEECHELLDVSGHLRILSRLLLPGGDAVLSPVITAVTHTVEDGTIVSLRITGTNLQYKPQICVSSQSGWPAAASVTSVSPRQVTATFSLVEMVGLESSVRRKPLRQLRVDVAFLTDIGYTSYENHPIEVPSDVTKLLFLGCRSKLSHAWLLSLPMNLIDNAIVVEPLLTTPVTKDTHKPSFTPQISTQILGAIATASEVASHYATKKQSVSLFTLVANVAARVSNSGLPTQAMTPMPIRVPFKGEAELLHTTMGEYVNSKKRTVSTLLSKLTTWKQRLQQGLPWLSDSKYGGKVRSLLSLFENVPPPRDTPLVSLELSLFTHILRYLRNTCGVSNLRHLTSLHQSMSFETFYQHVHPLFLASVPAIESAASDILLESAALWAVCLIFHLRCCYLFTHIVAVTGCPGSGCSTMCNTITRLSAEHNYRFKWSQRVRSVVIRRAAECELDDLKEVLLLGLSVTVIVVGEFADIKGFGYKATWSSIKRSMRSAKNQRLVAFLSKVDELVEQCSSSNASLVDGDAVRILCDTAESAAVAPSVTGGADMPKRIIAVSFAPSLSFLKSSSFVRQSGLSAEEFAEKLLTKSSLEVRRILLRIRKKNFC